MTELNNNNNNVMRRNVPLYAALLCLAGLDINLLGSRLVAAVNVPIYFDSLGTMLSAVLGGIIPGMAVGYLTNAINSVSDPINLYYGAMNVMIALITVVFVKIGWLQRFRRLPLCIIIYAIISGGGGSVITWLLYGFSFGTGVSAPLAQWLYNFVINDRFLAQFTGDILVDLLDKTISVTILVLILRSLPEGFKQKFQLYAPQAKPQEDDEQAIAGGFARRIPLRNKFIIVLAISSLMIGVAGTFISGVLYQKDAVGDRAQLAESSARMIVTSINSEREGDDMSARITSTEYPQSVDLMNSLKEEYQDIHNINVYNIASDGCHVLFDLNATNQRSAKPVSVTPFQEDALPYAHDLMKGKRIQPVISGSRSDAVMTYYYPMGATSDNSASYIVLDISMEQVRTDIYVFLIKVISLFFGIFILVLAVCVWLSEKTIVTPINRIAQATGAFAYNSAESREGSIQNLKNLDIRTGDEIENLYKSITKTTEDTMVYINDIQAKNQVITRMQTDLYSYSINLNLTTGKYSIVLGDDLTEELEAMTQTDDYDQVFEGIISGIEEPYKSEIIAKNSLEALRARKDNGFIDKIEYPVNMDGQVIWYETDVLLSTDGEGNRVANIMGRNITGVHDQEVIRRKLELANASNEAKTTFLFNMSHDIRTPMNAIVGYSSMAIRHPEDHETNAASMRKIYTASEQLLNLVNDILDMSRIESGKMEIQLEPASVTAAGDNLRSIFDSQAREKQIDMKFSSEGIIHDNVLCDAKKINRIIMNLISNALKFTPDNGHITVTATELEAGVAAGTGAAAGTDAVGETAAVNLGDEKSAKGAVYRFVVEDDGIGMAPEFLDKIFEPFEREQTSTVSRQQGTGLGMAIVKNLVQMMDGSISIESELGQGSRFIVDLPLEFSNEKASNTAEAKHQVRNTFQGKRVLLVDDMFINLELAKAVLTEQGLEVETASNGQEAVDMFTAAPDRYDVILMDIQMPVMNGYEATRAIRALAEDLPQDGAGSHAGAIPRAGEIPIIAMTANAFAEDKQNAIDAGMNDHVAKPIDIQKLNRALSRYLN